MAYFLNHKGYDLLNDEENEIKYPLKCLVPLTQLQAKISMQDPFTTREDSITPLSLLSKMENVKN
jgi:hypothetical protein